VKELWDELRESDPVAREPELTELEALVMRRAVLAALERAGGRATVWHRALVAAGTVVVAVCAGVLVRTHRPAPRGPQPPVAAPQPSPQPIAAAERRQLQFSTPGGTRIIWVFDPAFQP